MRKCLYNIYFVGDMGLAGKLLMTECRYICLWQFIPANVEVWKSGRFQILRVGQ